MPAKKTTTTSMIYQLKITLKDSKPPIWRRIQVKDDTTLYKLHQILQVAMGWTGFAQKVTFAQKKGILHKKPHKNIYRKN
jgi:hypothetical protein